MRTIGGLLVGLFLTCGCSSFDRQWSALADRPAPQSMEGRWQGTWVSDASGHSGNLRAAVRQTGADKYLAAFDATYEGIFRFGYDLPLVAGRRDGVTYFQGREDLTFLAGGVYWYDGHATDTVLLCTYRSKYDYGHFALRKIGAAGS